MGNANDKESEDNILQERVGDIWYKPSNSVMNTHSQNPDINVNIHALPPVAFQTVRRCLLRLPLQDGQEMKEEAIQRVVKHIVMETYDPGKDIILKGDSTKGVFFIVEGSVTDLSENGNEVFANLAEGDYFGEISLIFNVPCTARVQTDTSCVLAHLEPNYAQRLFYKVGVDIIDWFVSHRYLPTLSPIADRCRRRLTFSTLKACPVFGGWGEESLKNLILDLESAMIILYQPHTAVVCVSDPPTALHVIIRGRAVIKDDQSRTLVTIEVDNQGDDPVVIGEEGLYLDHQSRVSVITTTACEIIHIKEERIHNTLCKYAKDAGNCWEQRKKRWRALINKKENLHQQYPALLQFEVIYQLLKNSNSLSKCSIHCVQHLALQGNPQEYQFNDYVCIQEEIDDSCLVLVLVGDLELVTNPDMRYAYTVNEGELFCPNDWMGPNGKLVAKSESLTFDSSVVLEALKMFPDCELVLPVQPSLPVVT